MITVTLEYKRDDADDTSSGCITSEDSGFIVEEGLPFTQLSYSKMLTQLASALNHWPIDQEVCVLLKRTDREGLLPYKLDAETVHLLRTDPVAAIQSMQYKQQSPSTTIQRVREERVQYVTPPIRVGHAILADAFGEQVYFKVRAHELECPGCGYWSMFVSPGLPAHQERAGEVIKTAFVCSKKCGVRLVVTCMEEWGYVDVSYLLERTKLDGFYFPRAWNEGKPWVTRQSLEQKYNAFKREKEKVTCSETTR